jgi:HD-GYP domain-containing protein (c-di-GMP phosphodiesterase class II)
MMRSRYPLRTFVYRVLALRLVAAAALMAALFGSLAYFVAYDRIGDDVLQHARNEIEWLRHRVRTLTEELGLEASDAIGQAMAQEPEREIDRRHGRFVFARFLDADGRPIATWTDAEARGDAELAVPLAERPIASAWERPTSARVEFARRTFLDLNLPLTTRDGDPILAQALFRVSDEAQARVRRDALRTAGYVAVIVAAVALVLYPVVLTLTRRLARYSEGLLESNLSTLQVLGDAIAKRDSDTDAHNYRVTLYAVRLAEAAGLPRGETRSLIKGAFLHDVGKIGISDAILLKPERLNAEELEVMQTHVSHGLDIVGRSRWLQDATAVVGSHHEKYDGSGYPRRVKGEDIPVAARIFAIADVFDALCSQRPYKAPFSLEEAMRIMEEGRGSHFDPDLLDLFAAVAPALHRGLRGREIEGLRQELEQVVERYFSGGLETLRY